MKKSKFKTIITYVIEETGEVIKKEETSNYIIKSKIKNNVSKRNGFTRIEWTYVLEKSRQLSFNF